MIKFFSSNSIHNVHLLCDLPLCCLSYSRFNFLILKARVMLLLGGGDTHKTSMFTHKNYSLNDGYRYGKTLSLTKSWVSVSSLHLFAWLTWDLKSWAVNHWRKTKTASPSFFLQPEHMALFYRNDATLFALAKYRELREVRFGFPFCIPRNLAEYERKAL